jgi:hypothetical protein
MTLPCRKGAWESPPEDAEMTSRGAPSRVDGAGKQGNEIAARSRTFADGGDLLIYGRRLATGVARASTRPKVARGPAIGNDAPTSEITS